MKRLLVSVALFVAATELGTMGCNAILGNEPGLLSSDATVSCAASQKMCGATCVAVDDPSVGCGGACTVCATPANGKAGCELQNAVETCGLDSCNAQFDNCDNDPSNGCETHTTTRQHCGSCGNDCANEFCVRQGNGYTCSATCDAPNMQCGSECIDPSTDISNCGGCGTSCAVTNGTGTCDNGSCSITCAPNYNRCGNECRKPDQGHCTSACTPCGNGTTCDTNSGSATYNQCIPSVTIDAGGGLCTTSSECDPGMVCCGSACVIEDQDNCSTSCDHCGGANATCTNHKCGCGGSTPLVCNIGPAYWCCGADQTCGAGVNICNTGTTCGPPYACIVSTGGCGCVNGTSGCQSDNLQNDNHCGDCSTSCGSGSCCCAPQPTIDGGSAWSCRGTRMGAPDGGGGGSCVCPP